MNYRNPKKEEAKEIYRKGRICFDLERFPYSAWSVSAVRRLLENPEYCWVVEEDEEIVGFIGANKSHKYFPKEYGYIEWCYVIPKHRGKKIAPKLYNLVEKKYKSSKKNYIVADTTPDNKGVVSFLKRNGFEDYSTDKYFKKEIEENVNEGKEKDENRSLKNGIREENDESGWKILEKSFIGAFYAVILAALQDNLSLGVNKLIHHLLVFFGLFLIVTRWFHIHVVRIEKSKFSVGNNYGIEIANFYSYVIVLSGFYFAARYQKDITKVIFIMCIMSSFNILWNIVNKVRGKRLNDHLMSKVAESWMYIDIISLVVLLSMLYVILFKNVYINVVYWCFFGASVTATVFDYWYNHKFYFGISRKLADESR